MPTACDPSSLFDPQGNELNLDFDRGTGQLAHAPVIVPTAGCYGGQPVIKTHQGQTVDLILPVVDRNGSPIVLAPVEPEGSESSLESSSGAGVSLLIRFHAKVDETAQALTINKACTVHDAARGLVKVTLVEADLTRPGLQPAQLVIYSPDGDKIYQVTSYWLHIAPTLKYGVQGPLTLAEVRMVLADRCPDANVLLGTLEFDESMIAMFIRRAVDEFNEKYQPATRYNCQSFPWRYHWSLGVAASMLRSQTILLARNRLQYQAGGVTVADDAYGESYAAIASELRREWEEFIVSKKRTLNFESGYATQASGYSYMGYL